MAKSNREAAIKITLGYEGGYTNDPRDPGGPTNWGITINDARMYWKKTATAADVKAMPLSVAVEIYRKQYWDKMACDADPAGVDLATFDYGVNSGVGRAIPCRAKFKQPNPVEWVKAICKERLRFLHNLKTWSVFGNGWGSRVANVEARCVKMALEGVGETPDATRRKLEDEAKAAKTKATQHTATAGAATAAAAGAGTQAPSQDLGALSMMGKVGIAIAIVAVAVMVFWLVWHSWQNRQRAAAFAMVAKEVSP